MKKKLNVLYQSNDNYASITGISMTSLFENNKDLDEINIYLLNDNISKENLKKFNDSAKKYNREVIVLDTNNILKKLKELNVSPFKGTYTTYFKLIALNELKLKTDLILQLDGDTIINGSLKDLCNFDLKDNILAATYDCTMNKYKSFINIPETDKYYNGGVLLVSQKNWKKNDCTNKIIDHLKNVRNGYYTVDQDLLNVLFRNKFMYLDIKYNFNSGFYIYGIRESLKMYDLKEQYYNSYDEIKKAYDKPVIYHCMGAMTGRPWEVGSIHPQNDIFSKYKNISFWKDEPLKVVKRSLIFKIQRIMYKILPRSLYILFHKIAQNRYLSQMNKKVQGK